MKTALTTIETLIQPTKALLVCPKASTLSDRQAENYMQELESLVYTMGMQRVGTITATVKTPNPAYFMGSGKVKEISEQAEALEADCIVIDEALSPAQQRNWERATGKCVIDRHEVILEIFSNRASTREAVLQVGLARMEYSLPRLTRAWTHLSRQRGGTKGTRGEGETQLEMDRRIVLQRISRFKKELAKVRSRRETGRKLRESIPLPVGSIVGYTNAGKSTFLNSLTGSKVFVENKLFATLDPTTRRLTLPGGKEVLLTDTVGFIRKLPHDLVDAFRSTLEEITRSDFIIHLLDASNPEAEHHFETTLSVLEDIGITDTPSLVVFNKIDLCNGNDTNIQKILNLHREALSISLKTGAGLEKIEPAIENILYNRRSAACFHIPLNRYDLAAYIHRSGKVIKEETTGKAYVIEALVPEHISKKLKPYITTPSLQD